MQENSVILNFLQYSIKKKRDMVEEFFPREGKTGFSVIFKYRTEQTKPLSFHRICDCFYRGFYS